MLNLDLNAMHMNVSTHNTKHREVHCESGGGDLGGRVLLCEMKKLASRKRKVRITLADPSLVTLLPTSVLMSLFIRKQQIYTTWKFPPKFSKLSSVYSSSGLYIHITQTTPMQVGYLVLNYATYMPVRLSVIRIGHGI